MLERFPTPTPVHLDVRLPSGTVELDACATEETVVEVDASAELLDRTTVELRGDEVRVHVNNRPGFSLSFGREQVLVRVRCPEGSSLGFQSKSADLVATGRLGDVRAASASGDATLDRVDALNV